MKRIGFTTADGKISSLTQYPSQLNVHDTVRMWLTKTKRYDAVVWTALPPTFSDQCGPFTPSTAVDYLLGLPEVVRKEALDYIRKAPEQIATDFRKYLFSKQLI